jgi:CubicO group peptidase (beta-lactamase class C family)
MAIDSAVSPTAVEAWDKRWATSEGRADWRSAFDPSAQMQFDMADEAAFAETAELGAGPGTRWNYTNGNTMLLARMIQDEAGGDATSVLRFAHRELFDKLCLGAPADEDIECF